jgi:hypothetical protein
MQLAGDLEDGISRRLSEHPILQAAEVAASYV